jgi:lactate racemase
MSDVSIPYGRQTKTLDIPDANLACVVEPKYVPPVADLPAAVRAALASPIGSPNLKELAARHGTKTMILVDDGTRSTPQKVILPLLLKELNAAGVPDSRITVVIALGTHQAISHAKSRRGSVESTQTPRPASSHRSCHQRR